MRSRLDEAPTVMPKPPVIPYGTPESHDPVPALSMPIVAMCLAAGPVAVRGLQLSLDWYGAAFIGCILGLMMSAVGLTNSHWSRKGCVVAVFANLVALVGMLALAFGGMRGL
jgi:hypothetical protein